MSTITLTLLAESKGLNKGIKDANSRLDTFGRTATRVGKVAAIGFGVAAAAGVAWAKESVQSLARIERINAQTAQTIKSTGGAAGVSAQHIQDLAGRLENLTASEAEATQEGANMLLTFTNIRNGVGKGNKIFDQATTTLVDMTRALGSDPQKQAVQLGKALNDPIKGVSALSKIGVSFTDQQKNTIKSLVETGDTMGAQKVILAELTKEFGGSGKAFAKTAAGQAELAKHAFGTLGETIFSAVLPPLGKLATKATTLLTDLNEKYGDRISKGLSKAGTAISKVGDAFKTATGFVKDNADTFKTVGAAIGGAVTAFLAVGAAIKAWAAVQAVLNFLLASNPIGLIVIAVGALIGALIYLYKNNETVRNALQTTFAYLKTNVGPILTNLGQLFRAAFDVIKSVVIGAVARIKQIWAVFGPTLLAFARASFTNIKNVISGVLRVISGVIKVITSVIKGDWKGALNGLKSIASGAWQAIKAVFSQAGNAIKTAVRVAITAVVAIFKGLGSKIKSALGDLGGLLKDAGKKIIQGLIDGIESMIGSVTKKLKSLTDKIPDWKGPRQKDAKLLRNAGRLIIKGLIDGFNDGEKGVQKTLGNLTKNIQRYTTMKYGKNAGGKAKSVINNLRDEYVALTRNARAQDAVNKSLAAAKQRLTDLIKARADYASNVTSNVLNLGNVTGLDSAFTADAMVQQLRARIDKVKEFAELIKGLKNRGLNQTAIDQLVQAGVEGGFATASALAAGSAESIKELNALQVDLGKTATSLGNSTAGYMYDAGIQSAQGLVNGLNSQAKTLAKAAKNLALTMVRQIKRALGIKSPSRVMKQLGDFSVAGLQRGLSNTSGVEKASARLAGAVTNGYTPPVLTTAVSPNHSNGNSGNVTIDLSGSTFIGTDEQSVARWLTKAQNNLQKTGERTRA